MIKKNKMLEVKEKFLHLKADLEKQVSQRNAKIQSVETKLKQRELTMNQRQEELQRRNNEVEAVKENLSSQLELVEKKKQDLDKLHQKACGAFGGYLRVVRRGSQRAFDRVLKG